MGSAAGLIAPFFTFACILGAIMSFSAFSWTHNALSDLGIVPGLTSALFMLGLCGGGVLAFVFALLGLYSYVGKGATGKVGAGIFATSTLILVCIGIFNENFRPTHFVFSVLFFVLAPIAFFILTAGFYLKGNRKLAVFSVLIALIAAVPWILQLTIRYVSDVAIPETISGVAVGVWAVAMSILMLRAKK